MQYQQVGVISGKGSEPKQFVEALRGICVDREGRLYAVGDREVKVFDRSGGLMRRWETELPGHCVSLRNTARTGERDRTGSVNRVSPDEPLAVDSTVFVGQPGQVEKFDAGGKSLGCWTDSQRFGLVTSISFFGDFVLLGDAEDRCIRRYDGQGQWTNDIGKDNNTRGFLIPNGRLEFDVDVDGVIYASNSAKHRIERYSLDGKLLGHWGRFGQNRPEDFPGCCNPTNLTLGSKGQVIATEKAPPRLKVYDTDGNLLAFVGPDAFDENCRNMDVAVDTDGRIYVADTVRLHICVFEPTPAGDP